MAPIIPLLGYGALALGGGTLAGAYALPDLAFGSVKNNAKRELENYDPDTQTREKTLGDIFGDALTGRGAAIDKEVRNQYEAKLRRQFAGDISRIKRYLPNLDAEELKSLDITDSTNERTLGTTIDVLGERAGERKTALGIANAQNYGTQVKGLTTDEIYSFLGSEAERKETEAKVKAEEQRGKERREMLSDLADRDRVAAGIRQEERESLLGQQIRNQEVNMLQLNNQNAAALRSSQLDNRRLDLQEKRQDVEDRRTSRRDQQLALMTIMKGLAEMGSSITA